MVAGEIDILVIINSNYTPFILAKDFPKGKDNRKVRVLHVYTRANDLNMTIDSYADIDKIEYICRKYFGIQLLHLKNELVFIGFESMGL